MFRPRLGGLILIVVACLAATLAHAAGLRFIEVPADASGPALTGMVWTPCAAAPSEVALDGGVVLPGVKDCPVAGNRLPLIVVSHGRRGSFLGHVDTAAALADAGFVVAAINHPGDTARDSSRTDEFSVLVERPADMKRLTDFMLGAWKEAAVLDPKRVGLFGFSRGAYTGLVVIGGNPDFGACSLRSATATEPRRQNAGTFARAGYRPSPQSTIPGSEPPYWRIRQFLTACSAASVWLA